MNWSGDISPPQMYLVEEAVRGNFISTYISFDKSWDTKMDDNIKNLVQFTTFEKKRFYECHMTNSVKIHAWV